MKAFANISPCAKGDFNMPARIEHFTPPPSGTGHRLLWPVIARQSTAARQTTKTDRLSHSRAVRQTTKTDRLSHSCAVRQTTKTDRLSHSCAVRQTTKTDRLSHSCGQETFL